MFVVNEEFLEYVDDVYWWSLCSICKDSKRINDCYGVPGHVAKIISSYYTWLKNDTYSGNY